MSDQPLLFTDRDGVINLDFIGDYIKKWEEFEFLPGVLDSLKRIKDNQFRTILISNQAGIGDGKYKEVELNDITERMLKEIENHGGKIDAVYYCLHGKEAGCDCRKPKTGLFENAAREWKFDPRKTFYIGDKLADMQAGAAYGLRTVMVLTGWGEREYKLVPADIKPDLIAKDFAEAIDFVLRETLTCS